MEYAETVAFAHGAVEIADENAGIERTWSKQL